MLLSGMCPASAVSHALARPRELQQNLCLLHINHGAALQVLGDALSWIC